MTQIPNKPRDNDTAREFADSALNAIREIVSGDPEPPRQSAALTILVVARSGSFDKSLIPGLEELGHEVTVVSSQIEAVRHLASCHTNMLITDLCFDDSAGVSIIDICHSTCPDCTVVLSTDWAASLLQSGSVILEVDHIVSAMCRLDEIREILDEHRKRVGSR